MGEHTRTSNPTTTLIDSDLLECITPITANHILYLFTDGQEGYAPGSFYQHFFDALSKADPENKARLAAGFAVEVTAYQLAATQLGGLMILRKIAEGRRKPTNE